jgi:hypothetical protein
MLAQNDAHASPPTNGRCKGVSSVHTKVLIYTFTPGVYFLGSTIQGELQPEGREENNARIQTSNTHHRLLEKVVRSESTGGSVHGHAEATLSASDALLQLPVA